MGRKHREIERLQARDKEWRRLYIAARMNVKSVSKERDHWRTVATDLLSMLKRMESTGIPDAEYEATIEKACGGQSQSID